MSIRQKSEITTQKPIVISASRSTDIPAFYADWFINRLKKGFLQWTNPFNGVPMNVSFEDTRLIVFFTKNPKPMIKYLDYLDENNIHYYFQYTLNDYENEKYEKNVPPLESRIETFIELSNRIGKEKIIWRFDPLILSDKIGIDDILSKVKSTGDKIHKYCEKLVFSFIDIGGYKKVKNNLNKENLNLREFTIEEMNIFAFELNKLNQNWNLDIGTCGEKIDLDKYKMIHNKCVDDDLMMKLFYNDKKLMDFLNVKVLRGDLFNPEIRFEKISKRKKSNKDKGQRKECQCATSKDIGQYNTCPHACIYCYANTSKEVAIKNFNIHKLNENMATITGV